MKPKKLFPHLWSVLQATIALTTILIFVNCQYSENDGRLIFYINEDPIVYGAGISTSQLFESNGQIKYVIRGDLRSLIPDRGTLIKINLVRGGRSIRYYQNKKIVLTETLDIKELAEKARPEDHLVIELIGLKKGLPQIVSFKITD